MKAKMKRPDLEDFCRWYGRPFVRRSLLESIGRNLLTNVLVLESFGVLNRTQRRTCINWLRRAEKATPELRGAFGPKGLEGRIDALIRDVKRQAREPVKSTA